MERIRYKSGYKHQLHEDYSVNINIVPIQPLICNYIQLNDRGALTISAGYCWDGPSGPLPDTRRNMRASLVHDALYQLMRLGMLDRNLKKIPADKIFMIICVEDGTYVWLAKIYYRGLRWFGEAATLPKNAKQVILAPN